MIDLFSNSGNLLKNFSFETNLAFWQADNVTTTDSNAAEGTHVARMGQGVASLYQDVALGPWQKNPLFLSFIVYALAVGPGDLTAEVLWLNAGGAIIGNGLRALLPSASISNVRNTFFDVTDRPPLGAVTARLIFSKNTSETPLLLDLVNLVPVETKNLVNNPSFEFGLEGWNSVNFDINFLNPWEGGADLEESIFNGLLTQEIVLDPFRTGAAYLLSFATKAERRATITARLIWLDFRGNPVGVPGIDATVPSNTLFAQGKYLNIVQLSEPAPIGAVRARLEFNTIGDTGNFAGLDQVILVRLATPNLIQNSEFDNFLNDWTASGVAILETGGYVGQNFAQFFTTGGFINQTTALPLCSTHRNFMLNFALHYAGNADNNYGNVFAQVSWLNAQGKEIGLGLRLIVLQPRQTTAQWQVYTGITEPAPLGAVFAKVAFLKSEGSAVVDVGLDSVIFARID